jgi:hypothetical protein
MYHSLMHRNIFVLVVNDCRVHREEHVLSPFVLRYLQSPRLTVLTVIEVTTGPHIVTIVKDHTRCASSKPRNCCPFASWQHKNHSSLPHEHVGFRCIISRWQGSSLTSLITTNFLSYLSLLLICPGSTIQVELIDYDY